ncbi:MAG: DeoR/GlpR family DNA-binding transcription regulator [Planctomycetota bacterium]
MLASQRHREILDRVSVAGAARVVELARALDVAEETIRRDLKTLAARGALVRTHGGALPLNSPTQSQPVDPADHRTLLQRSADHAEAKQAIAHRALAFITPGAVVALDASSTALELARLLPDAPLTIVTNGLAVCNLLGPCKDIEVICTGGVLDPQAQAFTGLPAESAMGRFNVEVCFCSCMGVDAKRGMSEVDVAQASIKLRMIESATRTVLLADASKFGVNSHVFTAAVTAVDTLITNASDRAGASATMETLRREGLDVIEVNASSAEPSLAS